MNSFDEATRAQHIASEPTQSTWLSANAGSGKTRVLTDRVARLLLEGASPERILCLTYTKAAASEMQNRLFNTLGHWAMLDDTSLGNALELVGVEVTRETDFDAARTLFARAIETPGGLKIQTIHAFCAAVLRRFPVEARVPPNFTEIDDANARKLMNQVIAELAENDGQGVLFDVGQYISEDSFETIAFEVLDKQSAFGADVKKDDIWRSFGLDQGYKDTDLTGEVFVGGEKELLAELVEVCRKGSSTDQKAAAALEPLLGRDMSQREMPLLVSLLLFSVNSAAPFSAKVGKFPTKGSRELLGPTLDTLNAFMERLELGREKLLALQAAERTFALHRFANAFLPAYRQAKIDRGWLDFDDLIRTTKVLLSNSASSSWVLYKLDGGIDHILIDEAQDTSPAQWDVISSLAEEMLSGKGKDRSDIRTVFVVGDKKQSIYSFQGADPRAFDKMAQHFEDRLRESRPLGRRELVHSFRSSEAVLRCVDETYYRPFETDSVQRHRAYFQNMPGRVDLWPVVGADGSEDPENWWDPVDLPGANHHSVKLSRHIAEFIKSTMETESLPDSAGYRSIRARDFLILVQGRSTPLFHNIIRALKSSDLPVAGADRLELSSELAVRDLLSLLRFLALPEDDLALAEALRSPLFGLSEGDIFELCHARRGYLWTALRQREDRFAEPRNHLRALRNVSDYYRPYELLELILTDYGGRQKLISRLGREAEDGIDLLLAQAVKYERTEIPSLTGFLLWLENGDITIKRQTDQSGDLIRVMTVHGAKGLEAPIVIMPDTLKTTSRVRSEVLLTPEGQVVWKKGPATQDPPTIAIARKEALQREEEERRRLLYVAMTRAEKWLVICGSGARTTPPTWHSEISDSLSSIGAIDFETPCGTGLRYTHSDWDHIPPSHDPVSDESQVASFPKWADEPLLAVERPLKPLSPSSLGGSKSLPNEAHATANGTAYGTALHSLLEHLPAIPEADWACVAANLVDREMLESVLNDARRLLADDDLAHVFAKTALSEVQITANLSQLRGRCIVGAIDRLIVEEKRVLAVDFKSNTVVPPNAHSVPLGILRQMGAYLAALEQVFLGRKIEVAVLWTKTSHLMVLPHDIVMEALKGAPTS